MFPAGIRLVGYTILVPLLWLNYAQNPEAHNAFYLVLAIISSVIYPMVIVLFIIEKRSKRWRY